MTRPGQGQWPAMDTAALGQAVGALNAAELGSTDGGGGLSLHAHAWWLKGHCNGNGDGLEHGRSSVVGVAVTVQDANRGGYCWGSCLRWLRWGEGRKDEVKVNGPPPPSPFYKVGRQPKSLWAISL